MRKATALIIGPDEPGLFHDLPMTDLNALHRDCSTMEHGLVNNAIDALQEGMRGEAALQWAAEASVKDRLLARGRQIEEHMYREASDHRARSTRSRLEEAHSGVDVSGARGCCCAHLMRRLGPPPASSGLDNGVPW